MSDKCNDYTQLTTTLMNYIGKFYWSKMFNYVQKNNIKHITGFLLNPEMIVIYIGKTHIAMEYYGSETIEQLKPPRKLEVRLFDYSKDLNSDLLFFQKVIGIDYDSTMQKELRIPLCELNEELIIPTNRGGAKLIELGWNFSAQNSILGFNTMGFFVPEGQFARLINCIFFDEKDNNLITRRVKWMDFIPVSYDEQSDSEYDRFKIDFSYYDENWKNDLFYRYPLPEDFKDIKLNIINKFIELYGDDNNSEPQITSFLEKDENRFILNMAFFAKKIYGQLKCEWQSEDKEAIKPDFFIEKPNGYADIVEFKLPKIKGDTIVGRTNRERFSSEITSFIAQTRVYKIYFEDPNNRSWVQKKYGFKVYNPKRYIVAGRRWDFSSDVWLEIKSDYQDVELITYDDLIDGVISQFYN